ncbi:unnamed protein product [Strongylus vulgaris]|uniref:Uncharacterized protein n=1 Tax=Strongylus vulgaris TaxID=40348 RepID=A0A3P7IB22_STRVU|nr:unnamed protein product [Strongylus vulgaris]
MQRNSWFWTEGRSVHWHMQFYWASCTKPTSISLKKARDDPKLDATQLEKNGTLHHRCKHCPFSWALDVDVGSASRYDSNGHRCYKSKADTGVGVRGGDGAFLPHFHQQLVRT